MIFKRLLLKLATESTYIFHSQFYKQTDGCTMGGPLFVIFTIIYLSKLEKDQIVPLKPKCQRRFVDNLIIRRLKLNNIPEKIKFTIETNPQKFLDTRLLLINDIITTEIYRKAIKIPCTLEIANSEKVKKQCNKWRPISFMEN